MTSNKTEQSPISVIIPTYNRASFLEGAIKTALGQTYDNIEVIVVDDGSKERYAEKIAADFPESVRCIRHGQNQGLSAARNTGIEHANGEYIAFLDDDDRWHKTKLAKQVEKIHQDDRVGLSTCLVVAITPESDVIHCETYVPNGDCSSELLIANKIGTPSRVLIRQAAIKDIGTFDESLRTKQDWDFYLRLSQHWRIAGVEDHLCFRTIHKSMSSSPRALQRDKQAILKKHEELIRRHGLWDRAQANVLTEIGRAYLGIGDLKTSRENLKKSIRHSPSLYGIFLLCLCYTHPTVVDKAISLKRIIALRRSGCTNISITNKEIPGL